MGLNLKYWTWGQSDPEPERSLIFPTVPPDGWPYTPSFTLASSKTEEYSSDFAGYIQAAYQSNGPVFACSLARLSLFSEARFQWRQFRDGRPGPLFGNQELAVLEEPWPNGSTGDLITRMEQDCTAAGNFYARRQGDQLYRMRPDWTVIVIGSNMDVDDPAHALDAEIAGYVYYPGGKSSGNDPIPVPVEEVIHFAPIPDPLARFRGMSWITPIFRDIYGDEAATTHKQKYFEAGTRNLAVSVDLPDPEDFFDFVRRYREESQGAANAYKTLFFNSGTTFQTVGADMEQADYASVQEAGILRIASAAGVPAIIIGFEPATFANYNLAMRRFADLTARPWWRAAAAALQSVMTRPSGADLWYDDRDIPALKDDITAQAEVQVKQATALKTLFDAGFDADSAVDAIVSDDLTRLSHEGRESVQTQPSEPEQAALPASGDQPALPPGDRSVLDELENELERMAS